MSQPAIVFGIGAAKAGTGWLQTYLRDHDDCFFRNLKEIHYFDSLDFAMGDHYRHDLAGRICGARTRLANHHDAQNNTWLPLLISDMSEWLEMFDGQSSIDDDYLEYLGLKRDDVLLIGDFTPAYAGCSKEMLAHMFELGGNVMFIYILRDPVDRLWSHIRMDARGADTVPVDAIIEQYLSDARPNIAHESDYRGRIGALLEVVPPQNVHLEFFERLFTKEAIEKICGFLGISAAPARYNEAVHQGTAKDLDPLLRAVFQEKLKPQYEFVEGLFGGLPQEWTDKMVRL